MSTRNDRLFFLLLRRCTEFIRISRQVAMLNELRLVAVLAARTKLTCSSKGTEGERPMLTGGVPPRRCCFSSSSPPRFVLFLWAARTFFFHRHRLTFFCLPLLSSRDFVLVRFLFCFIPSPHLFILISSSVLIESAHEKLLSALPDDYPKTTLITHVARQTDRERESMSRASLSPLIKAQVTTANHSSRTTSTFHLCFLGRKN